MSLNKILLIILSVLTSCAHQTSINKNLATAKKSFIQIEIFLEDEECELASCDEPMPHSSGSGAVVLYNKQKHILTAAHVCNANNALLGPKEIRGFKTKFVLIDRKNRKHEGKIVKVDFKLDLCLIYSEGVAGPPLKISPKKPEYGEKVYNIGAPLSISYKNMVLAQEGLYSGDIGIKAYYTIPTAFGQSGSPIINARGELVGLIHSVHVRFHHISVSPIYSELWNFLSLLPSQSPY